MRVNEANVIPHFVLFRFTIKESIANTKVIAYHEGRARCIPKLVSTRAVQKLELVVKMAAKGCEAFQPTPEKRKGINHVVLDTVHTISLLH